MVRFSCIIKFARFLHSFQISDMSDAVKGEFDSDEETKIFGKRRVVEIHGGVFECVTLSLFEVHDVVSNKK